MLEISFKNSIQHAFAGIKVALKEQGPNLVATLVGQNLTNIRGFPIPAIQKYHMKGKQRGAPVKNQAKKLLG